MLLTTALLVIYGVLAARIGLIEESWVLLAGAAMALVASYGTAMLRPWARELVYLLTAGFVVKLGKSIYEGYTSGYFAFQFGSFSGSLRSLVPGLALVLISLACCLIVTRHFRGERQSSPRSVPSLD